MTDDIARHPLPWKQGPSGWMRLGAEPHEEGAEDGRLIRIGVGNCINHLSRDDVADLYRRLGDILMAPYRLIVAGGDRVPGGKLDAIGRWLDELNRNVNRHGWRLQVVTGISNDAQAAVAAWCREQHVEVFKQERFDLSIGGNVVGLLPSSSAMDIIHYARGEYDMPVYRMASDELWANPRPASPATEEG